MRRETRWDVQQGAVSRCGWVGGEGGGACSPHSQIKSAVKDYRESSGSAVRVLARLAAEVITGRAAPTSLGSREMKSR